MAHVRACPRAIDCVARHLPPPPQPTVPWYSPLIPGTGRRPACRVDVPGCAAHPHRRENALEARAGDPPHSAIPFTCATISITAQLERRDLRQAALDGVRESGRQRH